MAASTLVPVPVYRFASSPEPWPPKSGGPIGSGWEEPDVPLVDRWAHVLRSHGVSLGRCGRVYVVKKARLVEQSRLGPLTLIYDLGAHRLWFLPSSKVPAEFARMKHAGRLLSMDEVAEVWVGPDLGRKRAVIDCLMTMVVLPATKRGKGFDPERVRIEWKQ